MRRKLLAIGLLLATGLSGARSEAAVEGGPDWRWIGARQDTNSVRIDFVRGSARVVRRPGDIRIEVRRHSPRGNPQIAVVEARRAGGGIVIEDSYPQVRPSSAECLPPLGPKGNFWISDVELETVVYAPAGVPVDISIMSARASQQPR